MEIGDFIFVQFQMEKQLNKFRRFIGCILEKNDGFYKTKFLKTKETKKEIGYVFTYPDVDYIVNVESSQIIKKLLPPKNILRGALYFEKLSHSDLNV